MELIEREGFLNVLQTQYEKIPGGEGHCIFISGEAGIGKTSLVKAF
jgi:predicted ATPase